MTRDMTHDTTNLSHPPISKQHVASCVMGLHISKHFAIYICDNLISFYSDIKRQCDFIILSYLKG